MLASIFWDQDGILLIAYSQNGQTINAEYYLCLLAQFKDILKEKNTGILPRCLVLLCPLGNCNPEENGLPGSPIS